MDGRTRSANNSNAALEITAACFTSDCWRGNRFKTNLRLTHRLVYVVLLNYLLVKFLFIGQHRRMSFVPEVKSWIRTVKECDLNLQLHDTFAIRRIAKNTSSATTIYFTLTLFPMVIIMLILGRTNNYFG